MSQCEESSVRRMNNFLYIFLDEGGNFDFSPNGTKYFTITSVSAIRPFNFNPPIDSLRHDFIESGIGLEYFHASEDRQIVRDEVFKIITSNLKGFSIDSVIVEKAKVQPVKRGLADFYLYTMGNLLKHLIENKNLNEYCGIIIITDSLPVNKLRKSVEKAIQTSVSHILKLIQKQYYIFHHDSKSSGGLQIADYCNWAIYRKWDRLDNRSYDLISDAIRTEKDIMKDENECYY